MTEHDKKPNDSFWRWWPFFAGALSGPLLGDVLNRWLPLYLAVGFAMFIAWLIALWLFNRISPSSNWSIPRWLIASLGAGVIGGALAFLFPWK
jgi:uncharacterized membrane protein YjjB (DUF3815 family)